jgi:hypothetical protein
MKLKLTSVNIYIPDIMVQTDSGEVINNQDNDANDQIKATITMASIQEKARYINLNSFVNSKSKDADIKSVVSYDYNACIKKHVEKIEGLEDFGIIDGKTLLEHPANPMLNDLINDIFSKVNGTKDEDILTPKK